MTARADPTTRAAGAVAVLAVLTAGAMVVAGQRPAPDPLVDRASYAAGWRHADAHRANPGPSGLPAGADGTRAACQLWFDQQARPWDRDDFLKGCWDETNGTEKP